MALAIDRLLTPEEAAAVLQVSRYRIYELARLGVLPGVIRLGRQVRIDPRKLDLFIDEGGRCLPGGWRREARSTVP
jgi:excisionase family DNA binding protein